MNGFCINPREINISLNHILTNFFIVEVSAKLALMKGAYGPASGPRAYFQTQRSSFTRLNRRALLITDTEDRLMARAATIGDSRTPKTG